MNRQAESVADRSPWNPPSAAQESSADREHPPVFWYQRGAVWGGWCFTLPPLVLVAVVLLNQMLDTGAGARLAMCGTSQALLMFVLLIGTPVSAFVGAVVGIVLGGMADVVAWLAGRSKSCDGSGIAGADP